MSRIILNYERIDLEPEHHGAFNYLYQSEAFSSAKVDRRFKCSPSLKGNLSPEFLNIITDYRVHKLDKYFPGYRAVVGVIHQSV